MSNFIQNHRDAYISIEIDTKHNIGYALIYTDTHEYVDCRVYPTLSEALHLLHYLRGEEQCQF